MSDDDPNRHRKALQDHPDSISVMSSTIVENVFPDVAILARVGGESAEKPFKGKLDTGAKTCLISERVVANRWGIERINTSKWLTLDDLGKNGVRTMGEIKLIIRLGSGKKGLEVPFHVIPDSHVRDRYDALLSDKLIQRKTILVLGPDYVDEV
jgi:hypothetical protein